MTKTEQQIFSLVKMGVITKEMGDDALKLIYEIMQPSEMDLFTFMCNCDYWLLKKSEYERRKKLWE